MDETPTVRFRLDDVFGGWWNVSIGQSLDDIEYTIHCGDRVYAGGMYKLDRVLKLYECVTLGISSENHPIRGGYELDIDGADAIIQLDGEPIRVSRDELHVALEEFLVDVFTTLNEQSVEDEKRQTADYYRNCERFVFDGDTLFDYFQQRTPADERFTTNTFVR